MRPRLSAPTEPARTTKPPVQRSERQRRDQRLLGKTAGAWLPLRSSMLDRFSKNSVGRTGFEPVTSSVSGNSRVSVIVRVEGGATDLREESDSVVLRPREAEHVGSRFWLPERLEGWEPLKTPRSTRAARSSVPIRSLLRGGDSWRTKVHEISEPAGSGRPPGDHAWDAETAEWAGQVHVPRQPHMHDMRVIS
jgi:hypothetical protein